jgi:hypothetical protein
MNQPGVQWKCHNETPCTTIYTNKNVFKKKEKGWWNGSREECLPSKHKALSSNPSITKKKKQMDREPFPSQGSVGDPSVKGCSGILISPSSTPPGSLPNEAWFLSSGEAVICKAIPSTPCDYASEEAGRSEYPKGRAPL